MIPLLSIRWPSPISGKRFGGDLQNGGNKAILLRAI